MNLDSIPALGHTFAVIDTETAPCTMCEGVIARLQRPYDIGMVIAHVGLDGSVTVLDEFNALVSETWRDAERMSRAFFANNLPFYELALEVGRIKERPLRVVRRSINARLAKFGVRDVWAYNVSFDKTVLNKSAEEDSNGYVEGFLANPHSCWLDIMSAASRTALATPEYLAWATSQGRVCKDGRPRATAQDAYRYLTEDRLYTERHTALNDARDELKILAALVKNYGYNNSSDIARVHGLRPPRPTK